MTDDGILMAEWIAVDWGTTNLRAWAMDGDGKVISARRSDDGMGRLSQDQFEPALLSLIEPFLRVGAATPIICCGMVGARQGWLEAPYLDAPCRTPFGDRCIAVETSDPRLDVRLLPGVKQAAPPDVMRGEETQIAGYLSLAPDFDGIICLPGTHTKWVQVSRGAIQSFLTCMTGEMFSLLSGSSVLRHSVGTKDWDAEAFERAVRESVDHPAAIAGQFFAIRAENLLSDRPARTGRSRLSGLLLGLELAAAQPFWKGRDVALIGDGFLCSLYETALSTQGVAALQTDGDRTTLAGLSAAYTSMKEGHSCLGT